MGLQPGTNAAPFLMQQVISNTSSSLFPANAGGQSGLQGTSFAHALPAQAPTSTSYVFKQWCQPRSALLQHTFFKLQSTL
jgi:hypothetical protein